LAGEASAATRCPALSLSTDHHESMVAEVYAQTSSDPVPIPASPSVGCQSETTRRRDPTRHHPCLKSDNLSTLMLIMFQFL